MLKSKGMRKIVLFTIVMGMLALAFNMLLGKNTISYLERVQVNQFGGTVFYIYKYDFWGWLKNIQLAAYDTTIFSFNSPTREMIFEGANIPYIIGNNIAVFLNWMILFLNLAIFMPIRVIGYMFKCYLALIGINQNVNDPYNGMAWLVNFINNILGTAQIPYI